MAACSRSATRRPRSSSGRESCSATACSRRSSATTASIAAAGPKAAEEAGRDGDGFITTSGKGIELYRDTLLPHLEKGARAAGKDPDTIDKLIEIKVSYDTDRERALEDTREWAALALPAEDKAGVEDPREMERRAKAAAHHAHRRFIVATGPDGVLKEVAPYVELGFTHLVFHFPGKDQERAMRGFANEVLPLLRKM